MVYQKTNWVDRIVQFANRFTKSNETSSSVDLVANPGVVTQVGTPLSAGNLNKIEQGIADAHDMLAAAGTLPFVLKRGLNIASTTGPSPGNVTIYGRTLVNLLGYDGNFEKDSNSDGLADGWTNFGQGTRTISTTAANGTYSQKLSFSTQNGNIIKDGFTVDSSKYYVYLISLNSVRYVSGPMRMGISDSGGWNNPLVTDADASLLNQWQTKYVKFTGRSVLRVFVGNAANNDLDFLIDGARVYEVDVTTYNKIGVDPEYTGDKLADKFPYVDSVKHLQGAAVRKVGKNLLPSFTEGGWTFHANAAITEPYKLTLNSTGDYQASFIRVPALPSTQYILNVVTTATAGAVYPRINFYDSNGTQIGNIQNGNYSNRTFTTPAGTVSIEIVLSNTGVGTFTFTNMQLELGSVATPFQPYNADYFNVPAILASNLDGTIRDSAYVRDGQLVKLKRWVTGMQLDGLLSWGWNGDMTGYKRVAFPLTGISASNTSVPAIVNLQAPNGQLFKPLSWLNRGTEANSVSVDNNTSASVLLSVNDSDTGWGESYTPSTSEIKAYFYGYKMNNGTFGTPYDGTGTKTWTLWNATNNTGAVTTVPSTLAAGFTPYSLDYVLATSVEEVISGDVGSIALAPGGNQIELLEGVVVREKITPAYSTLYKTYEINTNNSVTGGVGKAPLKNTASQIIGAYRDRVKDNWKIVSDSWANGKQRASIDEVNYDPTADYFVTYILLDKYLYTANATDAKVEYQTTLGGTVAQNTQDIADVRTRNGIQDFGLDYIEAKADNLRIDYDGHAAKTTSVHGSTSAATANAIVQRDAAGQANFSTPTANSHAATKGYLDPLSYYVNVSDNVLLSLPTERGGSAMELKVIKLKYGGRYRIKAEVRSPTAGNSAQVSGRIGITLSDAVQSNPELSLGTSSATYVAVSIDTPYLPENSVIQLYNTLTPYGYIRNVTVCGDLVVGNPNTLSGVD